MRDVSGSMVAALQASSILPAVFVECHFKSEVVYVWSGLGSLSWNGQTWLGVGALGSIEPIEEGTNVQARGTRISLSGINPTLVTDVLTDYQMNLPVKVFLGLFDSSGNLIENPVASFVGRMDQPTITMGADTATISINCENRLVDMNSSVERRCTNEDQQLDHPGDRGFEYVNSIQDVTIFWGRHPSGNNSITSQGHG